MDLEATKQLINSPVVQRYIERIDADAQRALDTQKAQLAGLRDFPPRAVSDYKADGAALDKAWGKFNAEWNLVVFGKAKNGKAAMTAYKDYVVALTILEEDNVGLQEFEWVGRSRAG